MGGLIVRITARGCCYWWILVFLLAAGFLSLPHNAQALTVDEVALLKGADRQKVLEEERRRRGRFSGIRL